MTVHSRYESVSSLTDDLQVTCGLDEAIHPSILDYVKSRVLEDSGNAKDAMYFRQKYEQAISKKASRKSGVRLLIVPEL